MSELDYSQPFPVGKPAEPESESEYEKAFGDQDDDDDNLIEGNVAPETPAGELAYPNSPKEQADCKLAESGLERTDLPDTATDEVILAMPPTTINDLKMQALADKGEFYECIEMIRTGLLESAADENEYKRLQRFEESYPDSSNKNMRAALCKIAFDVSMARRNVILQAGYGLDGAPSADGKKLGEEGYKPTKDGVKPGSLNYNKVKPGINLQP